MCGGGPVWCRLCLTSNILPPYLDIIKDDTGQVEDLSSLLSLDLSISPLNFPSQICAICLATVQSFSRLKEAASLNDDLLHRNQDIISEGNQNVDEEVKNQEYEDDFSVDIDDHESISQLVEDSDIKTDETFEESKERKPVVLSILKARETPQMVSCDICGPQRLMKKYYLSVHMKRVHGARDIKCTFEGCTLQFRFLQDMKKHVRIVHLDQKKLCPICGESFKNIKEHIKIRHESEQLLCQFCQKVYYSESGLQYHLKVVHQNAKKTICHICAGEFRDIKSHMMYQHGGGKEEKTFPCRVAECEKMFRTSQGENIHYKAAHLNLKENCNICGGWFKNLTTHINQIHKSANKYPCEHCGKAFNKKCDLRLHIDRIHLQKRYKCPECGKVISKIREHLKTVHKLTEIKMEDIQSQQLTESV